MKTGVKRALKTLAGIVAGLIAIAIAYVRVQTSRFDSSIEKVYDIPVPDVAASTDPAVIARGKHLASSVAACMAFGCHGADLGGGNVSPWGRSRPSQRPTSRAQPRGRVLGRQSWHASSGTASRKTGSRALHAVEDISWLPQDDVVAIVSYLRSVPPVDRENQPMVVKALGKVLDRRGELVVDVARHIDRGSSRQAPAAAPTAEYGAFVARLCSGCHGEHLSGGPLPGGAALAPDSART